MKKLILKTNSVLMMDLGKKKKKVRELSNVRAFFRHKN